MEKYWKIDGKIIRPIYSNSNYFDYMTLHEYSKKRNFFQKNFFGIYLSLTWENLLTWMKNRL